MKEIKLSSRALADLYEDIGREQGLENILIRFYEKMSQDVLIGFFFIGRDTRAIALKQKSFLLRAWGVSPSYEGKSPADAHTPLPPILKGHFDRRLVVLAETLREFAVGESLIATWVSFENKFRAAVEYS